MRERNYNITAPDPGVPGGGLDFRRVHLDAVFQVVIIEDDPGPVDPEPGDDLEAVVRELARIGDVLERIERDGLLIRTS